MNKFIIEIPNEKAGTYRLVSFIILAINFFVFGEVFIRAINSASYAAAIGGLVINAIPAIFYLLNKRHIRSPFLEISFFATAVLWLLWGNYLFAILMVLFSPLSYFANRKQQVVFSEAGIEYPSFPVKKYSWAETEQVIFKDDILTIDLKNNKLIQLNIDPKISSGLNIGHFNSFCTTRTAAFLTKGLSS